MSRRAANVEQTRRRIVEATMALHAEKGVIDTTVADIAARADVAVGTIYRHFPTLDDLVDACGRATWELAAPPSIAVFADLDSLEERVRRLFLAFGDVYQRLSELGMDHAAVRVEGKKVAPVARWFAAWDELHQAMVRAALGGDEDGVEDQTAAAVLRVLSGWEAWRGLNEAGLPGSEAVALLAEIALSWLAGRSRKEVRPP
jgi:AcrR family transcriptional regulator